jgi:hypothetical protein
VGPRASLDGVKRHLLTLPGLELRPLVRLARSQSLYRLSYPNSCWGRCLVNVSLVLGGALSQSIRTSGIISVITRTSGFETRFHTRINEHKPNLAVD